MEIFTTLLGLFPDLLAKYMGLIDLLPEWVAALTATFMGLKAVTMITPTTHDNTVVNFVLKVLNFLALNILKDKNADDVPK